MRSVRIFFEKKDRAKYISHLDLNRTMMKCLRKARIPVWYTEGFNPHPFITFALPLALGAESHYETMDIKIEGKMTNKEILSRLAAVMPSGLPVIDVADPVMKANEIAFAKYRFAFRHPIEPEKLKQAISQILSGEELMAEKLSKKGKQRIMKQINLMEYIGEYTLEVAEGRAVLQMILPAGNVKSLNPTLLVDAICKRLELSPHLVDIEKLGCMNQNMEKFR